MKNDIQVNTSPVIDNADNDAAREERQMAREQRAAERYRKRRADQEMAAQKRAAALKDKPRPQWNAPECVKRDDGAVVAEVARYCAPQPPRTRGATWVRVGHMWMRFVTVSGRSGR